MHYIQTLQSSSFSVFKDLSCSNLHNLCFLWEPIPAPLQLGWGLWRIRLENWQIWEWTWPIPCIVNPRFSLKGIPSNLRQSSSVFMCPEVESQSQVSKFRFLRRICTVCFRFFEFHNYRSSKEEKLTVCWQKRINKSKSSLSKKFFFILF